MIGSCLCGNTFVEQLNISCIACTHTCIAPDQVGPLAIRPHWNQAVLVLQHFGEAGVHERFSSLVAFVLRHQVLDLLQDDRPSAHLLKAANGAVASKGGCAQSHPDRGQVLAATVR